MSYKIINKHKIHNGFFKLNEITFKHKKHDGSWSPELKREVFGGAHVVTVLPYDPSKKKILLVSQFRVGTLKRKDDPIMLEIVAGMVDQGEAEDTAARRECLEETGCSPKKLTKILSYYPAPGSSESYYHLYFAEIDSFDGNKILGQESENEDILVCSYTLEQIKDLISNKKIINAATLIALQWFFSELDKN